MFPAHYSPTSSRNTSAPSTLPQETQPPPDYQTQEQDLTFPGDPVPMVETVTSSVGLHAQVSPETLEVENEELTNLASRPPIAELTATLDNLSFSNYTSTSNHPSLDDYSALDDPDEECIFIPPIPIHF